MEYSVLSTFRYKGPLGIFLISFIPALILVPFEITSLLDEGLIVYAAQRILWGDVPYRDFYVWYAPGHLYLLALVFRVFGSNLLIERLYFKVFVALSTSVIYLISKKLTKGGYYAFMSGILYVVLVQGFPHPIWLAQTRIFFALFTLLLALKFNEQPNNRRLLTVGISSGLSTVFSQEIGGAIVVSMILFILFRFFVSVRKGVSRQLKSIKTLFVQIAILSIGVLAIILPVIFYFWLENALEDLIYCLFYYPLFIFPSTMGLPYPNIFARPLSGLIAYIPLAIYLITFLFLVRDIRMRQVRVPIVLILSFGLIHYRMLAVRDGPGHMLFGSPPAIVLGADLLQKLIQKFSGITLRKPRVGIGVIKAFMFVIIVLPAFYIGYGRTIYLTAKAVYIPLTSEKAFGIYMDNMINQVVDYIKSHTNRSDPIFVASPQTMFYFLSERVNPTRYNMILPGEANEEQQKEVIRTLDRYQVKYVIYEEGSSIDGKLFENYASIVYGYVVTNYYVEKTIDGYVIYARFEK